MMGNYHVPCGAGEKLEITSKVYLLLLFRSKKGALLYELDINGIRGFYKTYFCMQPLVHLNDCIVVVG
ncbi:hypothetical protein [Bacillus sp. 1NLA3E]|uniref:hypothetical protein n=1 Tax=Bacillus sp. 1NLA3E TaxID=666686 RepID=UPI0005A1160D|nr:hypothetical protein [Bacillus sp. 1NLA3E]